MSERNPETDKVRVVVAAPLAPDLCDRIAAVDPRVEVLVDQDLLPRMRHAADFSGDPDWTRTPEQQARYDAMLDQAEVLYGIPDVRPPALARTVAANPGLRWVMTMAAGGNVTGCGADHCRRREGARREERRPRRDLGPHRRDRR